MTSTSSPDIASATDSARAANTTALANLLARPAADIGARIQDIDTPALVLDLDKFESNIQRLQQWANKHGVAVRAHAKAHKCPEVALRQVAAGAIGICCQKVTEAVPFVQAGIQDILIANEIVGAPKLAMLAELTRHARMAVCVDDADNLAAIAQAMVQADTSIDILVEIDVGQGRCGVNDDATILKLAQLAANTPGVAFRGLQAYHGSVQHMRDPLVRRATCQDIATRIRDVVSKIEAQGIHVDTVSGAGTGSAQYDAASGIYTELQAGSYAFMDADYGANDWDETLKFDTSLSLLCTVMSVANAGRANAGRVVLDAGLKAMTTESALPVVLGHDGLTVKAVNDEHTIVLTSPDNQPVLGQKIQLVVPHVDPTFNLHDTLVTVRGGKVEALWPIAARGPGR